MNVRRLGPADLALMPEWRAMFGRAFDEVGTYTGNPPADAYVERQLADPGFFALAAFDDGKVIGGIAAYELRKFEQARSEIYLYDLAVAEEHRRQGVASALLAELRRIAATNGAWMIFVQADQGDNPAIALYQGFGTREEVLHFDISPDVSGSA